MMVQFLGEERTTRNALFGIERVNTLSTRVMLPCCGRIHLYLSKRIMPKILSIVYNCQRFCH